MCVLCVYICIYIHAYMHTNMAGHVAVPRVCRGVCVCVLLFLGFAGEYDNGALRHENMTWICFIYFIFDFTFYL